MKKLLISVALIFLSLNINAAILDFGITNLKQLNSNQIFELINGNTFKGYISDGKYRIGEIIIKYEAKSNQKHNATGSFAVLYVPEDKLYYGSWKVRSFRSEGCTYGFNVVIYTCYSWFTGIKDGDKYIFIKRNGEIIFKLHKVGNGNNLRDVKRTEDEKKIAEDKIKKAEDKIKKEKKKAEDKKIADEKKVTDKINKEKRKSAIIKARIDSQNNPGFRDLKPGIHYDDYIKNCSGSKCYGIQNISFDPRYKDKNGIKVISALILDMGPIASDGILIDLINEFADPDANIFRKMKTNFDTKYILEYEFSQRDRQLFNEREKSELLVVYSKGQVVLRITRDFSLYIEYRDISEARAFLKRNKPVTAAIDDF